MNRTQSVAPAPPVTAIVTLPPPLTGQTAVSQRVVQSLAERSDLRLFNWSRSSPVSSLKWKIRKTIRSILSIVWLNFQKPRGEEKIYTVANDGSGLNYNIWIARVARRLGFGLVIHHHSFAYLHQHDSRMSALVDAAGPDAIHLVLGPEMKQLFQDRYPAAIHVSEVPNYFMLTSKTPSSPDTKSKPVGAQFRLGHLSNLTFEKGIGRVVEVFEKLRQQDLDVELVVAGPAKDPEVQSLIDDCLAKHGDRFSYLGSVYDADKEAFFRGIDAFLFPTLYATEAQPLVLIEAMQSGKPVLSYRRACIESLVDQAGGMLVDESSDFIAAAVAHIKNYLKHPDTYSDDVAKTVRRASRFECEGDRSLQNIIVACNLEVDDGGKHVLQ